MKPALYYSVDTGTYGHRERVVAITSVKSRRWYGRECKENTATNGQLNRLKGKFDTVEKAEEHIAGIVAIRNKHEPLIIAASEAFSAAHRAQDKEIKAYLDV